MTSDRRLKECLIPPEGSPLSGRVFVGKASNNEDRLPSPAPSRLVPDVLFPKAGMDADSSDNELLEAVGRGDRAAFSILMRRHLHKMIALAQRVVFDPEQAREIAQEAFLRVWLNAHKWDPEGSATFITWLRRVVINFAISQRRKRREQVNLEEAGNVPDTKADSFGAVVTADRTRAVKVAMSQLPDRQRAALALFYFDDVSQQEAAYAMRLSPKAFDSLLVRARRSLKRYLSGLGVLDTGDLA